ncbi:unnamed protein product [Trichogramma brassicae]|uniref:Uncharacterized protein n=1 Tax=Trichogramma brassicae TaxID=86971 RepID=A0A6H5IAY6_9HYME|nr:unnamed protein product [Trichogramma brassicae]
MFISIIYNNKIHMLGVRALTRDCGQQRFGSPKACSYDIVYITVGTDRVCLCLRDHL